MISTSSRVKLPIGGCKKLVLWTIFPNGFQILLTHLPIFREVRNLNFKKVLDLKSGSKVGEPENEIYDLDSTEDRESSEEPHGASDQAKLGLQSNLLVLFQSSQSGFGPCAEVGTPFEMLKGEKIKLT